MSTIRGSEWRKWDLHVHTPASFHWNGGKVLSDMDETEKEEAIKKFVKTVNDSDVEVFAVQDYWTFDWILELRKYLRNNPGELKKTILPGMELRVECATDFRLNIHAIISDKVSDQELRDFRSELKIRWPGDELKNVSDETLKEYAGGLDASKAREHGFDDPSTLDDANLLKLGSMTVEVTRDSLSKALKKLPPSHGFIMLPYSTSDGIAKLDWKQHPADDVYFMRTAHLFEAREQKSIDLFNAVKTSDNEAFFDNFLKNQGGKAKPCTSGSDAHRFSDYGSYPNGRATWIKADPSFKGFEQIIYEPTDRVKVQQLKPEEKSDQLIIDYVEYKNKSGEIQKVPFNQNLNSLIGSRAQGKSNLLKNIAYAVDPDQTIYRNVDTSDFLQLEDFKVVWRDGSSDTLNRGDEKSKGILFIPQKFLGELLYGKDPKFDKFLISLFENRDDFKKELDNYRKNADQNIVDITGSIREVLEARENGIDKATKLRKLGNRDSYLKEIGALDDRIKQLGAEAKISEDDLKKYHDFNEEHKKLSKIIATQNSDITALNELKAFEVINADNIEEYAFSQQTYDKILKQIADSDKAFKNEFIAAEVALIQEKITANKAEQGKLEAQLKPLSEKIKKHESLISLTKRQGELRTIITDIEEKTKELGELRVSYDTRKTSLVSRYKNFFDDYKSLSIALPEMDFSKVELVIHFDKDSLVKWSDDHINYHNSLEFKRSSKYEAAKAFLDSPDTWQFDEERHEALLSQLVDGILNGELVLKSGRDREGAILELFKNRFKIDFLKSVTNKDGVLFSDMSDGEQMLALLEMIFKFDDYNYPVLLDQPEDDLDSRAISNTVVDFLNDQKKTRQIIIATHNANLVVCGDSENVLVSNKTGGNNPDFHYKNGSIEDEYVNAEILEILEGGVEAFEKRRKKIGK